MKLRLFGIIFSLLFLPRVHAQSEIFLCVDERGNKTYKNNGGTKGCKKLDLQDVTVIASPKRAPGTQTASTRPGSSPGDFPKIDSGAQKARDNDRRQILLDEMKTEETKLANLKRDFNGGEPERQGDERNYAKYQDRVTAMKEEIGRTEKNVEALRREIGNLK